MTTISRRALSLRLGAAALAAHGVRSTTAQDATVDLSGLVLANRIDEATGAPGLTVIDLAGDETAAVDLPAVERLFPVPDSSYGIAETDGATYVVDAKAGEATQLAPLPGTSVGDALSGGGLFPSPLYRSAGRYAFLTPGAVPLYLVDLERATVADLSATFAGEDPFFQAARVTPDGARLVLGTSDLVAVVALSTLEVERTLATTRGIRTPQLSPGGTRIAFVEPTGEARRLALRVADVAGDGEGATPFEDASGSLGLRWISDDTLLLTAYDRYGSTVLTRLDLATGKTIGSGVLTGAAPNLQVLANGTRAIASTDLNATVWWLIDLEAGNALRLPDLDDLTAFGPPGRDARAVLFGPAEYAPTDPDGPGFALLNTATGAITTTVARDEGQFYPPPTIAPDGRTAAIGSSSADVNELLLLDMVTGDLITVPDHLGAQFSPDGRHVLTRRLGRGNPLEIRDLAGDVVRELGTYDQGWWVG